MTIDPPENQFGILRFLGNNTFAVAIKDGLVELRFGRGFMFSVAKFLPADTRKIAGWLIAAADKLAPPKEEEPKQ